MKICVIGSGSSYTPELIEGFIDLWDELPVKTITLMDIDEVKLDILGDLATRMVNAAGVEINIQSTLDCEQAIDGADFVISQIRVGGMAARTLDEKIPPKYGVIGQETTGPGGFAKALRTIPVVRDIARSIEARAHGAFLLNFTNPAGLITETLARYTSVPVIGLCNLPIGAEMHVSQRLGVERHQLRLDWAGLNHLNWIRGASVKGVDCWGQVFNDELEESRNRDDDWGFSSEILETLKMIPCGYLNYYYNHDLALTKQQESPQTRGEQVQEIEDQLMEMYQDPNLKEKPELLNERGGAYYSKAAVSLVSALANDKKEIHIVNTVNSGAIPNLPPDVVIEAACVIDSSGAKPIPADPLPPEIGGLVQAVKAYEILAAQAGVEGDRRVALQALIAHPLTPSYRAAEGLLDDLLNAHRKYLPQFFPRG
jgi:6-phospho-beta-glucosidase